MPDPNEPISVNALDSAFAHHGDFIDATFELQHKGARWYDPNQGRFLSEDPSGFADGPNPYRFAGNDPVNFADPTGTSQAGHPLSTTAAYAAAGIGAGPLGAFAAGFGAASGFYSGASHTPTGSRTPVTTSSSATTATSRVSDRGWEYEGTRYDWPWPIGNGSWNPFKSQAAKVADQTAGKLGGLVVGVNTPFASASGVDLVVDGSYGAGRGATVYADALTFGKTGLHDRAVRYQREAVKNEQVLTQIGYGGAHVSARATQAAAIIATAGTAASYAGSTQLGQAFLSSGTGQTILGTAGTTLTYATPFVAAGTGASSYYHAKASYYSYRNGDYIATTSYAGSALIDGAFTASLARPAAQRLLQTRRSESFYQSNILEGSGFLKPSDAGIDLLNPQLNLPAFSPGKTHGVLVYDGSMVFLKSGSPSAAYSNYVTASHVEGKAALLMREKGLNHATVYQNNPGGVCGYCNNQLQTILTENASLEVVSPAGSVSPPGWYLPSKPYTGNAAAPKIRTQPGN